MTGPINDGGDAFPRITEIWIHDGDSGNNNVNSTSGMSLRDYLAAQVLADALRFVNGNAERAAIFAYQVADAALLVRNGQRVPGEAALEALYKLKSEVTAAIEKATGERHGGE